MLATVLVALAVNPVRVWLQGLVHRAFYGARDDPVRAFAAVGARLQEVGTDLGPGLEGVLEALCRALRLPAAAIVIGRPDRRGPRLAARRPARRDPSRASASWSSACARAIGGWAPTTSGSWTSWLRR